MSSYLGDPCQGSPIDESITFGVGGTHVNADVSFFNTEKIKLFYGKYLKDPNEFKSTLVRSETRNCFNSWATGLKPEEIVGDKQGKLLKDVQDEKFADVGVTFDKPQFSQAIEAQITARFQAEQQAIAAEAKGDAEVARIQQQSATSASIRLRELELQERAIENWNGVLPMYQGGSAPLPIFDLALPFPHNPKSRNNI